MSYDLIRPRAYISFDTYAVGILGTVFNNVRVVNTMDETEARRFIDTHGQHNQIYPNLPNGTPTNPSDFTFVKVKLQDGSTAILAYEWIKEDTIVETGTGTMRLTCANVTPEDRPRIIQALAAINITAVELKEV